MRLPKESMQSTNNSRLRGESIKRFPEANNNKARRTWHRPHSPRKRKNRAFQERILSLEISHSLGKTEVLDDLRLPESQRQMTYFAHPKNKDECQRDD